MQLTRAADYAVRVMTHLAMLPEGARLSRENLALAADVPMHFLSKVLQLLGRARLIVAHRGVTGGYSLAAPADQVSVLRVVEAVEGRIQLNVCIPGGSGCRRQGWCPAHLVWLEAQAALTKVLGNVSIANLASGLEPERAAPPWN